MEQSMSRGKGLQNVENPAMNDYQHMTKTRV